MLDGGSGSDLLIGGEGNDLFVFLPGIGGDEIIQDFASGDKVDLTAFGTSFKALDTDHDKRLEAGECDGNLTIQVQGGDTLLVFAGGSIRIEDAVNLKANDFLF